MSGDDKKKVLLQEETEQIDESSLMDLELGEYFLHIYIQETNSLQLADVADLMVKVKAFNQEKVSKIIKEQGPGSKTFWGIHFFFDQKFQEREDLENSNFEIELLDHNSILRNEIIGKTQGQVHSVYKQKGHLHVNKWAILVNTDKINQVNSGFAGFLKYSVTFLKSNEPRINIEDAVVKYQTEDTKIMIPANIQLKKKQVVINLFKAENLTA